MKVIFAADIHLRETVWVKHPLIKGDSFDAFSQLCKYAVEYSKKDKTILILGGDIFDSIFPSGESEKAFLEGIKLLEGKVQVLFIEGNHDKEATARPLLWGCTKLSETPTVIDGVSFVGINYTRNKEQLQETLSNIAACDFLILHSPFKHLLGFAGKWQLEYEDIPPQVGKVLVGDIHIHSTYKNIYSPGSLSVNGISEFETEHGFFVFDTTADTVEHVSITTRHFKTVYWPITTSDLPKVDKGPIPVINIVFTTDSTSEVDSFIESNKEYYFIKNARSIADTSFDVDSAIMQTKEEVLSSSVNKFLGSDPTALIIAVDMLLNKDKPEEVLAKAFKEYIDAPN